MENKNNYDYWNAILAGLSPDEEGHWQSRVGTGNQEGLILKSMEHPTLLNTLVDEMNKGYMYWYKDPEERKMYTFNKIQDVFKRMNADKFKKVK
jgi:hypothetical protein